MNNIIAYAHKYLVVARLLNYDFVANVNMNLFKLVLAM